MNKRDQPAHIVVINDTPQLLDLFVDLLSDEGYRVTTDRFTMETGQLLASVKEQRPDLIVLDLIVNDEQLGWQFLQMLKMDRGTRKIPVIVCSAAVRLVTELQPHLQDMNVAVVLKPFDVDHLLEVIADVLADPPMLDHD